MMRIDWDLKHFPTFKRILSAIRRGICTVFRYTWKPALALTIVLAAAHGTASYYYGKKVEAEIAKIKAKGEFVSLVELGGPKIPDSKNGAVLYEKAFKEMDKALIVNYKSYHSVMYGNYPFDDVLEQNTQDAEAWAAAMKVPGQFKDTFAIAEKAAKRPECRFKVKWADGYAALFNYVSPVSRLARLYAVSARVYAHNNQPDLALKSVEQCLKVGEALKDDPIIISQMVRTRIIAEAADALRYTAQSCNIGSNASANNLSNVLSQIDVNSNFTVLIKSERTMSLNAYDAIRAHRFDPNILSGQGVSPIALIEIYTPYLCRPFIYVDELDFLKKAERMIIVFNRPYHKIAQSREVEKYEYFERRSIGDSLRPAYSRLRALADSGQAKVNGSRIFLALLAYRNQFNQYPESLVELNVKFGSHLLLLDPMSGKRFVYKLQDKGFLLYSIGPNLKDDGGVPVKDKAKQFEEGDIVWKMDR